MKAHSKVPRPAPSFAIPDEARFDGEGHYPAPGPVRKYVSVASIQNLANKHTLEVPPVFNGLR